VLTREGKPGENRGRKALGLKLITRSSINTAMTAKPPKVDFCLSILFFRWAWQKYQVFLFGRAVSARIYLWGAGKAICWHQQPH